VEKYRRSGQAVDDNMAHVHCMMDTQGYKHTLVICIDFPLQHVCLDVPRCYVIRTLPVLLKLQLVSS